LPRDDGPAASPWLNIDEAVAYARVARKVLYKAIAAGRLRAAHVDGRRKLIIHREWLDAFLSASAPAIVEIPRRGIPPAPASLSPRTRPESTRSSLAGGRVEITCLRDGAGRTNSLVAAAAREHGEDVLETEPSAADQRRDRLRIGAVSDGRVYRVTRLLSSSSHPRTRTPARTSRLI